MKKARVHEWAWRYVGKSTVCGLIETAASGRVAVVNDLGTVEIAERCKNCERIRAALVASRKPEATAV
jgi:hypothetical protein